LPPSEIFRVSVGLTRGSICRLTLCIHLKEETTDSFLPGSADGSANEKGKKMASQTKRLFFCLAILANSYATAEARSFHNQGSFDVYCSLHERKIRAYNPDRIGYVSYSGPASFRFTGRMTFDLNRMLYRDHDWSPNIAEPIQLRGKSSLLLRKHSEGVVRYDLRTNRYYSLQVASAYSNLEVTGRCRRLEFSGIAPNPRRVPRR
jgi:hypothetical protein